METILNPTINNPDNLTEDQVNLRGGWRLLNIDELEKVVALPKNDESVEEWNSEAWDLVSTLHLDPTRTYRTKSK